jgi:hypothetical protein
MKFWDRVMKFWKGFIAGPDGEGSMTKGLTWLTFALITASWFAFPERPIAELLMLFGGLLGGRTVDKWGWHKHGMQNLPEAPKDGEQ